MYSTFTPTTRDEFQYRNMCYDLNRAIFNCNAGDPHKLPKVIIINPDDFNEYENECNRAALMPPGADPENLIHDGFNIFKSDDMPAGSFLAAN